MKEYEYEGQNKLSNAEKWTLLLVFLLILFGTLVLGYEMGSGNFSWSLIP